jgi:hypothetical protein
VNVAVSITARPTTRNWYIVKNFDNYWTFQEFNRWLNYHGVFASRIKSMGLSPQSVHLDHENIHFWIDKYKINHKGSMFFSSLNPSEIEHGIVNVRMKCLPGSPIIESTNSVNIDDMRTWIRKYYGLDPNNVADMRFATVGLTDTSVWMQVRLYIRNENNANFWLRGIDQDNMAAYETRLVPIVKTA